MARNKLLVPKKILHIIAKIQRKSFELTYALLRSVATWTTLSAFYPLGNLDTNCPRPRSNDDTCHPSQSSRALRVTSRAVSPALPTGLQMPAITFRGYRLHQTLTAFEVNLCQKVTKFNRMQFLKCTCQTFRGTMFGSHHWTELPLFWPVETWSSSGQIFGRSKDRPSTSWVLSTLGWTLGLWYSSWSQCPRGMPEQVSGNVYM